MVLTHKKTLHPHEHRNIHWGNIAQNDWDGQGSDPIFSFAVQVGDGASGPVYVFEFWALRLAHGYVRYAYTGAQKAGRGRPKEFDGRLDAKNVCTEHFGLFGQSDKERLYEGRSHIRSLGRWCRVVVRQTLQDGQVKRAFVYFSTDDTMSGEQVLAQYQIRFQIEFLYRDLGLNDCQSRQPEALAFHVNLSLSMLNLAKALHWMPLAKENRPPFSMANIKTQYSNEQLLDQLIRVYGKDPNVEKNNPNIRKLYDLLGFRRVKVMRF